MIVGNHPMNQSPFAVKTPFQTNIAPQQMQSGIKSPQPPEQK